MPDEDKHLDLASDPKEAAASGPAPVTSPYQVSQSYDPRQEQEGTRGDLARGLLWLLTFAIGGVLVFVGLGRLDGAVITQSIFPSLIALAGTALGFYFGSQTGKADSSTLANPQPLAFTPAVSTGNSSASQPTLGSKVAVDQGNNA